MKIRDILRTKPEGVHTIGPEDTVLAAVQKLSDHRIGALVVVNEDDTLGIISERDLLNLVARDPDAVADALVQDIMTQDVIVGVPDDDLDYVMNVMTENRIRHLPIMTDHRLEGIVSIGDVVHTVRKHVETENRHLKDYIAGVIG